MRSAPSGRDSSQSGTRAAGYQLGLESDGQEDLALFFEDNYDVDDDSVTEWNSQPARRPVHWGEGIEAQRASRYRTYDISLSKIFQFLQNSYGTVTRPVLDDLITAVVSSVPEGQRPKPPGRNQRRARNGLVMWLDANSFIVWRYLTWNFMQGAYATMHASR
jgi:hypothetical protein